MKLTLRVDNLNQWFASAWVVVGKNKAFIEFKIDNGCNALVLSHSTLKVLGLPASKEDLLKLQDREAVLASGEKSIFKKLGDISLYSNGKQPIHICNAQAICHATRETRDLMGTEVFKQFADVNFHLTGNKYMELLK